MANPVKAQTQDGQVFDIGDIQVVAEYIDPLYKRGRSGLCDYRNNRST